MQSNPCERDALPDYRIIGNLVHYALGGAGPRTAVSYSYGGTLLQQVMQ